jgi:hypothetical protein
MSLFKSTLIAGAMTMAYMTGAVAQNLEAWDIRERSAYVVMMDGSMKIVRLGDKGSAMLMKHARKVPKGMVFLMHDGALYMVNAGKMFDRAGAPSFSGM